MKLVYMRSYYTKYERDDVVIIIKNKIVFTKPFAELLHCSTSAACIVHKMAVSAAVDLPLTARDSSQSSPPLRA